MGGGEGGADGGWCGDDSSAHSGHVDIHVVTHTPKRNPTREPHAVQGTRVEPCVHQYGLLSVVAWSIPWRLPSCS